MGSVEVAVSQVVTYAGDLGPGDAGLGVEQVGGQCLDGFADLQQSDPDSVEDQAVSQSAALQVRADRVDGGLYVSQPLPIPVAHSGTRSRPTRARTSGLRSAA
ncbi:MAG TPA: hypothetical protein VGH96_08875, partial [Streptosporangiaceae bacterium]